MLLKDTSPKRRHKKKTTRKPISPNDTRPRVNQEHYNTLVNAAVTKTINKTKKRGMVFRVVNVNVSCPGDGNASKSAHKARSIKLDKSFVEQFLKSQPSLSSKYQAEDINAYLNDNGTITIREKNGNLVPGYCSNPGGKPAGAKNTAHDLRDVMVEFFLKVSNKKNGNLLIQDAMEKVFQTKPEKLLSLAASLSPKESTTTVKQSDPAVIVFD